jgi:hypothetical protein
MKAKYIKRRQQFEREASALLESLGAVKVECPDPWPVYSLATLAGPLRLSIHTDLWSINEPWSNSGGLPWIATRFEDVKAAHTLTGRESNPYSGKWNHHIWFDWTSDFGRGLESLRQRLLPILTTKTNTLKS